MRSLGAHAALLLLALLCLGIGSPALAQGQAAPVPSDERAGQVRVDGQLIVQVRGISSFPARQRARLISGRIRDLARDKRFPADGVTFRAEGDDYLVVANGEPLVRLVESDAALEGVPLPLLAEVTAARISESILKYRADRSPASLWRSAVFTAVLTVVLLLLVWALRRLRSWLEEALRERVNSSMASLERKSGDAVHRGHLWRLAQGLLQALWVLALLVTGYFYLSSVLGTFPWTRGFALLLLEYIKAPLVVMGSALIHAIPDLMFLVVLWFVVRFLLQTTKTFFEAVELGRVRLANFEADWAMPTYRLLRIAIIAFALVVAYPYIPGSESAAFKGVSLFLGVIVSIGSTSFISNLIAGIALTYRGLFREGEWVQIGDQEGCVEEIRSQLVRLRTRDNELISIPSSTIINANVSNLSQQRDGKGLGLRCHVGIGYDVAWRTVETLLLSAARDTAGVLQEPAPRVITRELGDFAVQYSLLARVEGPAELPRIRSELNRAILDRFHEAQVQIMSPAYENDPATAKIPPQD